jgi:fatty acid desaturase
MLSGGRRYLDLQIRARTGLTRSLLVWLVIAAAAAAAAVGFAIAATFLWLADTYGPLVASLILSGTFLVICVVALVTASTVRRRTKTQAELALAAQRSPLLDPRLLAGAVQVGRLVGGKRVLPLLALGALAVGIGMHRLNRQTEDRANEKGENAE